MEASSGLAVTPPCETRANHRNRIALCGQFSPPWRPWPLVLIARHRPRLLDRPLAAPASPSRPPSPPPACGAANGRVGDWAGEDHSGEGDLSGKRRGRPTLRTPLRESPHRRRRRWSTWCAAGPARCRSTRRRPATGRAVSSSVARARRPSASRARSRSGTTDAVKSKAGEETRLRIYWAWNDGKGWTAPDGDPRWTFTTGRHAAVLYKLYVIRDLIGPAPSAATDPCQAFLQAMLPEMQKAAEPGTSDWHRRPGFLTGGSCRSARQAWRQARNRGRRTDSPGSWSPDFPVTGPSHGGESLADPGSDLHLAPPAGGAPPSMARPPATRAPAATPDAAAARSSLPRCHYGAGIRRSRHVLDFACLGPFAAASPRLAADRCWPPCSSS